MQRDVFETARIPPNDSLRRARAPNILDIMVPVFKRKNPRNIVERAFAIARH